MCVPYNHCGACLIIAFAVANVSSFCKVDFYQLFFANRLPWKVLLQQAAKLASGGFPVSKDMAEAINAANISRYSASLQLLLRKSNDTNLSEGDLLKMPELANVLEVCYFVFTKR